MNQFKKAFVGVYVIVFVGAILVTVAIFLPYISYNGYPVYMSQYYVILAEQGFEPLMSYSGYILALILYPATIALGLFSFFKFKPKLTFVAGILGIIGFAAGLIAETQEISVRAQYGLTTTDYGFGLWISLVGVILILAYAPISKLLGKSEPVAPVLSQASVPPKSGIFPSPPGSSQAHTSTACQTCGGPLTFVTEYNRWYCQNCKKYA
jgi:hypothetical protein